MSVKWYALEVAVAIAIATGLCQPGAAQIAMSRPGMTPVPPPKTAKKVAAPSQQTTLTAAETKRLNAIVKHMKPKERKKLAAALQKMTPQQRQQLLASVKRQLAQTPAKSR